MKKIVQDYLNDEQSIRDFFNQPLKPDWNRLAEEVLAQKQPFLVDALLVQNKAAPFAAQKENLEKLTGKEVLLVVTGQQLGLFVSPLYIIYKALSAIALSHALNATSSSFTTVPVFWLESEDHDFEEVNQAFVFDRLNRLQTIKVEGDGPLRLPVGQRSLPESFPDILEQVEQMLQPTEFSLPLMETLRTIYQPGQNWLQSFKNHLQQILGPRGLMFFNPGDAAVKRQSLPFFQKIIEQNELLLSALEEQTKRMAKPQVPLQNNRSYLFYLVQGKIRQPVLRKAGGMFQIYGENQEYTAEQLIERLEQNPERLSCGVLTRPLWQSFMLPVISYVAGPGEIAYWAQLKKAFNAFRLTMPHVQPRFSATLIEPRIERLLQKFQLQPAQVTADFNAWSKSLLRSSHLEALEGEVRQLSAHLKESRNRFEEMARDVDPTLSAVVNKSFKNMENTLQKMSGRLEKAWRQKHEKTIEQLQTIHGYFFPQGKPQERVLSPLYYLNKFGSGWLQKVFEAIDLQRPEHKYVRL